ncbi:MAG: helix-turn-helix transcriptional regulator [Nitrospinae bacterium]|nr:helix-turn-helix transcriptional regulator [Nitrospinota bacterium]MBF0633207.1 helix-turn-helix transcriptional regulator [Nitrospinota bacterium]
MKAMNPNLREQVAAMLKAIAHPTRLLLLEELLNGERCVCELVPMTGADFSTVSKHLALLKAAGLVKSRKQELNVHYSIAMRESGQIIALSKTALKTRYSNFLKAVG